MACPRRASPRRTRYSRSGPSAVLGSRRHGIGSTQRSRQRYSTSLRRPLADSLAPVLGRTRAGADMSLMPEGIVPTEPVLTILVDIARPRRGSRLPYGGALTGWMHSTSSRPNREQRRAAAAPGELPRSIPGRMRHRGVARELGQRWFIFQRVMIEPE